MIRVMCHASCVSFEPFSVNLMVETDSSRQNTCGEIESTCFMVVRVEYDRPNRAYEGHVIGLPMQLLRDANFSVENSPFRLPPAPALHRRAYSNVTFVELFIDLYVLHNTERIIALGLQLSVGINSQM